jgi:tRNA pseudouridine32 synthase/23S rRNA pseudouridine746 synthase/23S rRNA pseudouridine1911/1915/1917 synthase
MLNCWSSSGAAYDRRVDDWPNLRERAVLLEDESVLVLDKPAGIAVTGERHDTDVVRLAADAGETLFPVHRIDKVTSGVVLLAKTVDAHGGLTRQFNKRTVDKAYLVITRSTGLPERGSIDLPLGVGRKNRVRIAAAREAITYDEAAHRWSVPPAAVRPGPGRGSGSGPGKRSYPSITRLVRLAEAGGCTVLLARPETGRRHQIRVHLAWIGHPIAGDPLFDKAPTTRTCLHAWHLAFDASWSDGRRIHVEAPPPPDFWAPLAADLRGGVDDLLGRAHQALAAGD